MTLNEKLDILIRFMLDESDNKTLEIPVFPEAKKSLLRALTNMRPPNPISEEILKLQDEYLQEENQLRGIVDFTSFKRMKNGFYLWKGDITRVKCDAIVNAANGELTGCYLPCHNCLDNCVHTYAGMRLREYCAEIIRQKKRREPVGQAEITPGFNLPCKHIIHTVGPAVSGRLTRRHKKELASCYSSCLKTADENYLDNVVFCCVSTGVFGFPNKEAAEIAVETAENYKKSSGSKLDIAFCVYADLDEELYKTLLSCR